MECIGYKRILSSDPPCWHPEHHAPVGTYDILHIPVRATDIPQITAAPHCFHERIEKHHCLLEIPHHSRFTGQPQVHEYLSPISSPFPQSSSVLFPIRYPETQLRAHILHPVISSYCNLISYDASFSIPLRLSLSKKMETPGELG